MRSAPARSATRRLDLDRSRALLRHQHRGVCNTEMRSELKDVYPFESLAHLLPRVTSRLLSATVTSRAGILGYCVKMTLGPNLIEKRIARPHHEVHLLLLRRILVHHRRR